MNLNRFKQFGPPSTLTLKMKQNNAREIEVEIYIDTV